MTETLEQLARELSRKLDFCASEDEDVAAILPFLRQAVVDAARSQTTATEKGERP